MTSLLLFTIGPVQGFIAAGRRTADLWAGSSLLSRLAGRAVAAVEAAVGPDAFLFPARGGAGADAALPNRLLVRVPTDRVAELAEAAEAAVREEMRAITTSALERVGLGASHAREAEAAARFVEVAWASVPETEALDALLTEWPTTDRTARSYRLVESLAGGRKALRDFEGAVPTETSVAWPSGEAGVRCTLIPALPALVPSPGSSVAETARFWERIAAGSKGRVREGERLSAVALAKRFFPDYLRRGGADDGGEEVEAFPSTSSFAAADFWIAVLQSDDARVREAAAALEAVVARLPGAVRRRYTEEAVPAVERASRGGGPGQLHRRSGRLVVGDPLTPEAVLRDTGESVSEEDLRPLLRARRDLLAAADAAELRPPSRYYAVLVLDGDKMGEWLSGARGADAFEGATEAERHRIISRRLRVFASEHVPRLIEGEQAGRLIYGGGDDVVAILSFETALGAARSVYTAFQEAFHSDATASAGLVFAHHLTPLQQVLDAARAAEKRAKNHVRADGQSRDQLTLTALKRSGDPARVVIRWSDLDGLQAFADLLREGRVSTGYAYDLGEALHRFRAPDALDAVTGLRRPAPVPADLHAPFRAEALRLFARRARGAREAVDEAFHASVGPLLEALPPATAVSALQVGQFLGQGGDR